MERKLRTSSFIHGGEFNAAAIPRFYESLSRTARSTKLLQWLLCHAWLTNLHTCARISALQEGCVRFGNGIGKAISFTSHEQWR